MSQLALPAPFEYLCYGSNGHYNCLNSFSAGIDSRRFGRQILTSKYGHRAKRGNVLDDFLCINLTKYTLGLMD